MRIPIGLGLQALNTADSAKAHAWRNDWRIIRWCRQRDVISDVDQAAWYERQSKDPSIQMYGVWLKTGGGSELVGVAGLTSLDWFNRRAEFSLYIDPERQRQGLGRGALAVLLAHAFTNLALEQVWGEVFDGNPALNLFAQQGFQVDGKRRGWYWKDGKAHDAHLISITRSEWHGHNARAAVSADPRHAGGDAGATETESRTANRSGAETRGRRKPRLSTVVPRDEPQNESVSP